MDESILAMQEERLKMLCTWGEVMSLPMIKRDHLESLCSNEKIWLLLETMTKRIRPPEEVDHIRRVPILHRLQKEEAGENDSQHFFKQLDYVKKSRDLKLQLMEKQKEIDSKKKIIEDLKGKIQESMKNVDTLAKNVNEEKKKAVFLDLNHMSLQNIAELTQCQKKLIEELLEQSKIKWELKSSYVSSEKCVQDALKNCLNYIMNKRRLKREQQQISPTSSSLDSCDNSKNNENFSKQTACKSFINSDDLKKQIIYFVKEQLKNYSVKDIIGSIISLQHQLNDELQKNKQSFEENLSKYTEERLKYCHVDDMIDETEFTELQKLYFTNSNNCTKDEMFLKNVGDNRIGTDSDNRMRLHLQTFNQKFGDALETSLQEMREVSGDVTAVCHKVEEQQIAWRKFNNEYHTSIKQLLHLLLQLLKLPDLLTGKISKALQSSQSIETICMDQMHNTLQMLLSLGMQEVHVFSKTPLLALQQIKFPNGKLVGAYELLSNDIRLMALLKETPGETTHDMIINYFAKLKYAIMLQHILGYLSPLQNSKEKNDLSTLIKSVDKKNAMLGLQNNISHDNLAVSVSFIDEVEFLLNMWREQPLSAAVPKTAMEAGKTLTQWYDEWEATENLLV